jgi:hypothetical protein
MGSGKRKGAKKSCNLYQIPYSRSDSYLEFVFLTGV